MVQDKKRVVILKTAVVFMLYYISVSVLNYFLRNFQGEFFYPLFAFLTVLIFLITYRIIFSSIETTDKYKYAIGEFIEKMDINPVTGVKDYYDLFEDYSDTCLRNRDEIKTLLFENNKNALDISLTMKDSVYHTAEITGSVKIISEKIEDLTAAIEQSSSAVNQITQTVSHFADRIEDQSSAIIETSSSVEQMSSSIANINKVTVSKKEKSVELLDLTGEGEKQMNTTNQIVGEISDSIKSVTDVISVINDIADQTNLLAMNAAIEAAHAGDAGRGFSVVADEIRKLAESTASNSRIISQNLKKIVDGVQNVKTSSTKSLDFFKEIKSETSEFVNALEEIINTTEELDIGSREIVTAVTSLVNVSEEIKNGSNEMKISANEINNAILDIRNAGLKTKENIIQISEVTGNINEIFNKLTNVSINSNKVLEKGLEVLSSEKENKNQVKIPTIIMQHILWLIKVRSMLDDRLELDADKVTDHHSCELGRWIMSPGFDKHRNGNDGLKLESIHEKLHSEIKNIIESRNSISRERLEEMFTSLLEISNEVVELLVRINTE